MAKLRTSQNNTVQQIAPLLNDVVEMALGTQAIKVVDTSSFISLGEIVNSTARNVDAFWNTLWDVVGRTTAAIRAYNGYDNPVKRDEISFGALYRKISYKMLQAVENPTWEVANGQQSPYDVEASTTIMQKVFRAIGTWTNEDLIPTVQIDTAFNDPMSMEAVISGIYISHNNAYALQEERLAALARSTYIANVINSKNPICCRYLLTEYNTLTDGSLTADSALVDMAFLKYATREITQCIDDMKSLSTLFNIEGAERHTSEEFIVVEMLTNFVKAAEMYLQADTFHNTLVSLPNYVKVPFWQGTNDLKFATKSQIAIKVGENSINQTGVVAFIHDYDAVASTMYKYRSYAKFNERSEVIVTMDKAERGMITDLSENGVVFILA